MIDDFSLNEPATTEPTLQDGEISESIRDGVKPSFLDEDGNVEPKSEPSPSQPSPSQPARSQVPLSLPVPSEPAPSKPASSKPSFLDLQQVHIS